MRLGLKLLNSSASINQFNEIKMAKIAQGETTDLIFQLVDLDQSGIRYMPAAGATVQIQIPRNPNVLPDPNLYNTRITQDLSINRPAVQAFVSDGSIWKTPLTAADTQGMISTNIRVVVTEGSVVRIATLTQAIKIINDQDN